MLLRVAEIAKRLSISSSKVYQLIEKGELPHHRIGGAVRVSEEQLAAYLEVTKRDREVVSVTRRPSRPRLRHIKL